MAVCDHVFSKDPIACCGIRHQNMRHGANDFATLNNGTSAHALHNSSGPIYQSRVCDTDRKVLAALIGRANLFNTDLIPSDHIVIQCAVDIGSALLDLFLAGKWSRMLGRINSHFF